MLLGAVLVFLLVDSGGLEHLATTSVPPIGQSFTFLQPPDSYLLYNPHWNLNSRLGFGLTFRTSRANTFLLHNTFALSDIAEETSQFWIKLDRGQLQVVHDLGGDEIDTIVGRGLNHDEWHSVSVRIDLISGNVSTLLDLVPMDTLTLPSAHLQALADYLINKPRTSIADVGGFPDDSSLLSNHFVGCIKNIEFYNDDDIQQVSPQLQSHVERGCVNACSADDTCQHGGACVNHYTHTSCDCFDTGYEGRRCNKPGGTTLTFQGSEWLTYLIYDSNVRTHSPVNRIALDFKTRSPDSVLFFGCSQTQYNHLAVSLHNGSLHVSVVFVDQQNYDELWLAIGSDLNDNNWHRVVINHRGEDVHVTLDEDEENISSSPGNQHLHMDPAVYFGGLDAAHSALGLRSQNNFVGCLRNLYFNHNAVLEKIGGDRTRYHGDLLLYGCQDILRSILQFSHQGAFLKTEHSLSDRLEVSLHFRTLKPESLLLYTETTSSGELGYIQVLLRGGQIQVLVVPSVARPSIHQSVSIGERLADNAWHAVNVYFQGGATRVDVDGEQSLTSFPWQLTIQDSSYLGFGPDTHMEAGFIGCMKDITLQQRTIDPAKVVHTQLAVGLTLGPCDLEDHCRNLSGLCHNGGRCVSVWQETYCDCTHTEYEGDFCQFAQSRRTCDESYQLGRRRSGVWILDLDGSGNMTSVHVTCQMGVRKSGQLYGVTWIDHNLHGATPVRGYNMTDHRTLIKYRELNDDMLESLVAESAFCQQWVHINCSQAPIRLGELTWLSSPTTSHISSLGGRQPGVCGCHDAGTCINRHLACNCDQGRTGYVWDGGYITQKSHLPITQMSFKQDHGLGHANITLGPLQCWGSSRDEDSATASITQTDAYMELPAWTGGALEFQFQTRKKDGVLFYQPSSEEGDAGDWSKAQLYVLLHNGDTIVVMLGRSGIWQTIKVSEALDNGRWHHVTIEPSMGQLKVMINAHSFLSNHQGVLPEPGEPSVLYVGGKPGHGISPGCHPACHSNPCVHEAVCEERWTSYICKCKNPRTQTGQNCEIDLNEDEITFAESASFLKFRERPQTLVHLIGQEVLFSFRTHQQRALLLLAQDHNRNYLKIEVTAVNHVTAYFYYASAMLQAGITLQGVSDGRWHQVSLRLDAGNMTLDIDNHASVGKLPPQDKDKEIAPQELPTLSPREDDLEPESEDGYAIYIGGVRPSVATCPGLIGCMRGLRVGDMVYDLNKAAQTVLGVQSGCPLGCASNPCENGGQCNDGSGISGYYQCDCADTGYAGRNCNQEIGMYFDGDAWVSMKIREYLPTKGTLPANNVLEQEEEQEETMGLASRGTREKLTFNFATYIHEWQPQSLISVGTKNSPSNQIVVYLTAERQVAVKYLIEGDTVLLTSDVRYTSGWPHHVTMTRDMTRIRLQVDHSSVATQTNGSFIIAQPLTVTVGGFGSEQHSNLTNFTGDISNVFFYSDWLYGTSVRPLETFLESGSTDDVIVAGTLSPPTQSLSEQTLPVGPVFLMEHPQAPGPQVSTFPPWDVGPAQTVGLEESPKTAVLSNTAGNILGYMVCVAVFVCLGSTMAYILWRAHRQKPQVHHCTVDEEEGLIRTPTSPAVATGNGADTSANKAVNKRGTRWKKPSTSSGEVSPDDEETEETPMLSGVEDDLTSDGADDIELSPLSQLAPCKVHVPAECPHSSESLSDEAEIYITNGSSCGDSQIVGGHSVSTRTSVNLEWDDEGLGDQLVDRSMSASEEWVDEWDQNFRAEGIADMAKLAHEAVLDGMSGGRPNSSFLNDTAGSEEWRMSRELPAVHRQIPLFAMADSPSEPTTDESVVSDKEGVPYESGRNTLPGVYSLGPVDLDSSYESAENTRLEPSATDDTWARLNLSAAKLQSQDLTLGTATPVKDVFQHINKLVPPVITFNPDDCKHRQSKGSLDGSSGSSVNDSISPPISINGAETHGDDPWRSAGGLTASPEDGDLNMSGVSTPLGVSPVLRQSAGKVRMNSKRKSKKRKK